MRIHAVTTTDELATARRLFEEYAASLGFNIEFQGFQEELASLPGEYAEPRGCILLAEDEGQVQGCVAMRPLSDSECEMKRLYVMPDGRGKGLGRMLAAGIIGEARRRGYERMLLDTVASMDAANELYGSLGFRLTDPYRYNPLDGATFYELNL